MSVPLRLVPLPAAEWPRQLQSQLRRCIDWWVGQLFALLPQGLRRWMERAPDCLVFSIHDGQITTSLTTSGETRQLGRFSVADKHVIPSELRTYLQRGISDQTRVVAQLPRDKLLQCTLKLPAAAQENLRQVLGYEMDLHTPFTAEQVCFDYRITAAGPEQIEVELHVAARELIDEAIQLARRLGLRLHTIDTDDDAVDPTARPQTGHLNLLPVAMRPRRYGRRQIVNRGLGLMMILLVAVNLAIPFWRQGQQLTVLHQAADIARKEAETTFFLRDQRDALLTSLQRIQSVNRGIPSTLAILDELSRLIPDDTWLQRLEINGHVLQLHGESAHASALIGLLDSSPLLEDVNFRSPVTQDPRSGKENFLISARLAPEDTR